MTTLSNYVYLPPPLPKIFDDPDQQAYMDRFRKCLIEELTTTKRGHNALENSIVDITAGLEGVTTPPTPSISSATGSGCELLVTATCSETVTGYEFAVSNLTSVKKTIYYVDSADDGNGYLRVPILHDTNIWVRAVNRGVWAERRSDWGRYDEPEVTETNVLDDDIVSGTDNTPLPNMTYLRPHVWFDKEPYYKAGDIIRGVWGDTRSCAYWDADIVYVGENGVRILFDCRGPNSYGEANGFLVLIPDEAMTGLILDWAGEKMYYIALRKELGPIITMGVYEFTGGSSSTDGSPMAYVTRTIGESINLYPAYVSDYPGMSGASATFLITVYCTATQNRFVIKNGAGTSKFLDCTDDAYLWGPTRRGVGIIWGEGCGYNAACHLKIDALTAAAIPIDPGFLSMERGGTGADLGTGGAIGDILIASTATSMKRLAGNTTTTKKFLSQTGTGAASADPSWELATHVILDSTWHTDSTTGTVVRGDLITGQGATPKWTRLAAGTAGDLLNMGANEPQWSSATTLFGSGTDSYIPKFLVGATPTFTDSILYESSGVIMSDSCELELITPENGWFGLSIDEFGLEYYGPFYSGLICGDDEVGICWDNGANQSSVICNLDSTVRMRNALVIWNDRSDIDDIILLRHNIPGTPADGFSSSISFQLKSDTTDDQDAAQIAVSWTDATYATRKANMILSVYDTAIRTGLTIAATGTAATVTAGGTLTTVGRKRAVTTQTTTYTVTTADEVVVCNSTTAFTVTLPAATGSGQTYAIANINTGVITLEGDGSDTINGDLNQTIDRWACIQVVDYAANAWVIIGAD